MLTEEWKPTADPMAFFKRVHQKVMQQAAVARGIKIHALPGMETAYRLEHLGTSMWFSSHLPASTSSAGREFGDNKRIGKAFLQRAGVSVPSGQDFSQAEFEKAWQYAQKIGLPVVTKPLAGTGGSGVTSFINSKEHFGVGWKAASHRPRIIVEQHILGKDYRLLVAGDKFIAATWRDPFNVIGDGRSSISHLIKHKEELRKLNPYLADKKIELNSNNYRTLAENSLDLSSILPEGKKLYLQSIANVGAGGDSHDVTDQVHQDFKDIALLAASAIPGISMCGVDLLVPDITKSASGQKYSVCEINSKPDISLHHFPVYGTARDAAGSLLEHFFPLARKISLDKWKAVSVSYRGNVTGVGFRKKVASIACLNGVHGYVKNLSENNVEAEFFGSPTAVDRVFEQTKKITKCNHEIKKSDYKLTEGFSIL